MREEQRIIDEAARLLDMDADVVHSWFEAFVSTVREAMQDNHGVTVGNLGVLLPAIQGPRFLPAAASRDVPSNQPRLPFSRVTEETARRAGISTETCTIIAHAVFDSIRQRLSTGEAVSFEALGTWTVDALPTTNTSRGSEDGFPTTSSAEHSHANDILRSPPPVQENGMERSPASMGERKAVDLGRLVREVTAELGLPLPVQPGDEKETGEGTTLRQDPSNEPLDIDAIGRLAREYIRKASAEPQRPRWERSSSTDWKEEENRREFDALVAQSITKGQQGEAPASGESPTEGGEVDSRAVFEQNRQHLFHPPVSPSRKGTVFLLVIAAVIAACVLLYLGWTMNLFDPFLPQRFKHAKSRVELLSTPAWTTPGITLAASATNRPDHPAPFRSIS